MDRVDDLRRRRDVAGLIAALESEPRDEFLSVRAWAARALSKVGSDDPRAAEALILLLRDADERVQTSGAAALARLADPRAVEPLVDALGDPTRGVRRWAAQGLGRIGDLRASDGLARLLEDDDAHTRRLAADALATAGNESAIEALVRAKSKEPLYRRNRYNRAIRAIRSRVAPSVD